MLTVEVADEVMKVLIIGGSGMLGHKLVEKWRRSFEVWTTIRKDREEYQKFGIIDDGKLIEHVDVENYESVSQTINRISPAVIVNAAGIIKQLPTSKNVIKTLTVNAVFPHQLAEISEKIGARLITVSTDCVFSGKKGDYVESDIPDAEDLYGKSKNLGEVSKANCLTIRTSIIGRELFTSHSLVEWFLNNREPRVRGFVKAVFSGFPTVVLAKVLEKIITDYPQLEGLYHVSSDPINKYELLKLMKKAYRLNTEIDPCEEFVIDRSLNSAKFRLATNFVPASWNEMVDAMASDNTIYEK